MKLFGDFEAVKFSEEHMKFAETKMMFEQVLYQKRMVRK